MTGNPNAPQFDVILVGAGIMSSTLGVLLKEVEPALTISMVETRRLSPAVARQRRPGRHGAR
jgi:hypothetical protein